MLKWTFELEAFDINYRPRTSIRSQVLADFIAERTDEDGPPAKILMEEEIPEPYGTLPAETEKARAIKIKSRQYIVIDGVQYQAQGKVKFLIVAIDYFTKWIEETLAHRTMIKTINRDTLFSLTYGTESVIPIEIGMPSLRCAAVDQIQIDEALLLNLDMLEEKRERAVIRKVKSKTKMEKYYNTKVRSTTFKLKDFVYHNNEASYAKEGRNLVQNGKEHTKWWKHLEKEHIRSGTKAETYSRVLGTSKT
uniref:Reverse transcriptase domain-containing protein n=1 Tax=Tanacetum cinerariifolium TaxID=118510 RepID=A0A6L2K142_TANCI|nr:reverse transcriptase domain-containing protein [Tanacetum cinerariifolium]